MSGMRGKDAIVNHGVYGGLQLQLDQKYTVVDYVRQKSMYWIRVDVEIKSELIGAGLGDCDTPLVVERKIVCGDPMLTELRDMSWVKW